MRKQLIVSVLGIVFILDCYAQLESTYWYFRRTAGIEFTQLPPIADTNSNDSLSGYIGGSGSSDATSISDIEGNLLFYASYVGVFNAAHQMMPNGHLHLSGASAAENGALIVPRPEHPGQYYFFYLRTALQNYPDGITAGLFYNLVDMELDDGLGDVVDTVKNVFLTDSTEEKITATPHANGVDYWVVVRKGLTNEYLLFLVTSDGIDHTPVVNSIGSAATAYSETQGNLRFNHAGNMMADLRCCPEFLQIYDFDNQTASLSNLRTVPVTFGPLGLEFSPDDSKLYVGGPTQFDLTVPTASAIQASEVMLGGGYPIMAGLQMGLDGKIYGNHFNTANDVFYMDVINDPNKAGTACGYQDSAIYLDGRLGGVSVPQFLSSYFKVNFYADTVCVGEPTEFWINFTFVDSVFWNFGDPGSGAANTDTAIAPSHVYSNPGSYTVTLIAQNGVRTDTVIKTIEVLAPPEIDLGPDQEFCAATDSIQLGNDGGEGLYTWNTGSTDSTLWVDQSGTYALTFTNACGMDADTVEIIGSLPLKVTLPDDTSLCSDSFLITPTVEGSNAATSYQWMNGSSQPVILIKRASQSEETLQVSLTATNACGSDSDSVAITFLAQPDGILPDDSIYCLDRPFYLLNPFSQGISYVWIDSSSGPDLRVDSSGTYSLLSFNECDTLFDAFTVTFNGEPKVELGNDTFLCPEVEITLANRDSTAKGGQTWRWNTGVEDSILNVTRTTKGWVMSSGVETDTSGLFILYTTLNACTNSDSIRLYPKGYCPERCKPGIANVITPNGDGINDVLRVQMLCNTDDLSLFIYNRWGQLIHQGDNATLSWDGTVNSEPAAEGTYFFVVAYTDEEGIGREYRGSFSLLRG